MYLIHCHIYCISLEKLVVRSVLWLSLITPTSSATTHVGSRIPRTDTILQRAPASQSNSPKTTLSETNCSLYLQPAVTCIFVLVSLSAGFSSGSDPGTKYLYIQMEFCEGDTLRAWIDKNNSSDVDYPERRTDGAQINRQVLKAVEYIHKEGLIHRDLKVGSSLKCDPGPQKQS